MLTVMGFTRDLLYAVGDGLDLAIQHLTPSPKGVRIYEYWRQAQESEA